MFRSALRIVTLDRSRHVIRRAALALFLGVLAGGASVGLLALSGWFITMSALAGAGLAAGFSFFYPSAGVQALAFGRTVIRYFGRVQGHDATLRLDSSIKERAFDAAVTASGVQNVATTGALLHAVTSDAEIAESSLLGILDPTVTYVGVALGGSCVVATVNVGLAAVVAVAATLLGGIVVLPGWLLSLRPGRELASAESLARQELVDGLEGLDELLAFCAESDGVARVERSLEAMERAQRHLRLLAAGTRGLGMAIAGGTVLFVAALSSGDLGSRPVAIASASAITLAALGIIQFADPMTKAVREVGRSRAIWDRLNHILSPDDDGTPMLPGRSSAGPAPVGSIDVNDLRIDRGRGVVIEGLSFVTSPGTTVLVAGPSGAGKSSLLATLTGQIRSEAQELQLVGKVVSLPQHPYVFRGTVADNLRLAAPDATDEALEKMINLVGLGQVLARPPLQQQLGSGRRALSGGQSRRLIIAQALLAQPDVLIADEPTEGLDALATSEMLLLLRNWNPSCTLVLAMHEFQIEQIGWTPDIDIRLSTESTRATVTSPVAQ